MVISDCYAKDLNWMWVSFIMAKYEKDEVGSSIDVVKNITQKLNTTVDFLLGETEDQNALKDPAVLKRLNDIDFFPSEDKGHVLYTIDVLIKPVKLKSF